jgi:hypothetical protein
MNQSVQSLAQGIPPIVAGIVVSINMYLPITLAAAFTLMAWFAFYIYRQSKNTSN